MHGHLALIAIEAINSLLIHGDGSCLPIAGSDDCLLFRTYPEPHSQLGLSHAVSFELRNGFIVLLQTNIIGQQ